jgi:predicted O-methyltransferase YrrM
LQAHVTAVHIAGTDIHHVKAAPRARNGVPGLIDLGLDGFLWPSEAEMLYELAFNAPGAVLELGTYRGLSTLIMATALADRGDRDLELHTCDLRAEVSLFASRALRWHRGRRYIRFHVDKSDRFLDRQIASGRKFGLIFVDQRYGYEATRESMTRVPALLGVGGFVVFHDYNEPGIQAADDPDTVKPAVDGTIGANDRFELLRIVGSAAVFCRVC